MNPLADEHMHVLYNLQKTGIEDLSQCSREELKPYRHLKYLGLIIYGFIDLPDGRHILHAELSHKGKDFLASIEHQETNRIKDRTIAILALLISIASLLFDLIEKVS